MPVKHLARVSRLRLGAALAVGALLLAPGLHAVLPPDATPPTDATADVVTLDAATGSTTGTASSTDTPGTTAATAATARTSADASTTAATTATATAASPVRVAVYMPFDNGGRTGIVLPRDHTPRLLGGFSWDLHKAPGAAVRPQMSSPDGEVSLRVARIDSNNNGAGTMVTLDVSVAGTFVGQIRFGHLRDLRVSTSSGPFSPGTQIGSLAVGTAPYAGCADGTSDGWPYSSSWRVCTTNGIHTHTDLQRSCWASFGTNVTVGATTPIAVMSTASATSRNAQCSAAELQDAVLPAPVDGQFVVSGGRTYRLAGGAPVYVSSWAPFGGQKPTITYSASQFAELARYPADGTLLRGLPSQRLFRVAGGSPLLLTSAPDGPVVEVDDAALDRISTSAPWDRLLARPADGTFLIAKPSNAVFRVAGGSPQWVDSWTAFGGRQPTVTVDDATIDRVGEGGDWDRLTVYPADGTVLRTVSDGRLYRVAGGAPLHVRSLSLLERSDVPVTTVADTVVDGAGWSGRGHRNLLGTPADGTFVYAHSGGVYTFVGGAAFFVESWNPYGGPSRSVHVDAEALAQRGTTAQPWGGHVRKTPYDGTFVRVLDGPSAGTARAAGRALFGLSSCARFPGCAGASGVTGQAYATYTDWIPNAAAGTLVRFLPTTGAFRFDGAGGCSPVASAPAGTVEVNDYDHPCTLAAPAAPGTPQVVVGDRSAEVSWTAPTQTGGRPLTGYTVAATPAGGGTPVSLDAAAGTTRAVLDGLANGTGYTVQVRARNAVGTSVPATAAGQVVPRGVPGQVGGVSTSVTASTLQVSWSPAYPNGASVSGYVVTVGGTTIEVPGGTTRATVPGLTQGRHTVTVTARNVAGSSTPSAARTVVVTAAPPRTPAAPTVRASGTTVTVSWAAADDSGGPITGYTLVRDDVHRVELAAGRRSLTLYDVPVGRHTFVLVATNASGSTSSAATTVDVRATP
ncbi:fibronectin type III domain-containing protein [Nocardioides zeae]|uniref:Fibronectin type III domain-containing protein n=1 Tax=Nocardioides imazamoxiresistens TaxID=3231893 RepID=A0ABU3PRV4_9ACTN|nr:fibronectin type III domain-containing protein [Nocardioides zeae]MDT9591621.1 fibronectin type III domain-containing protein [Nocardioides zeae]